MEKNKIALLLNKYNVQDIEKHLVLYFIKANLINIETSKFLQTYFLNFNENIALSNDVRLLEHTSLEDLAVDMELLIPSNDRKLNGAFFTPSYIVDYIIKSMNPTINSSFADISCGCGAFLLGVIRYMQQKYNISILQCVRNNIFGVDVLQYNVNRCKLLIVLSAILNNEIIDEKDFNIICADSLKYNFKRTFDFVVGNPPYVKFQDMEDETRTYLMNNFITTKSGTYNLYFAFFEKGLELLNKEGKLGYITPNNYFTSLSGESLRSFFQKKRCVHQIVDFNATKVFSVQTYTAITFINKKTNKHILYDRISSDDLPLNFLRNLTLTHNDYNDLSQKKWRLLCGNERENIYNIENLGEPIGQLFNICVGIATLKDEVFFIDAIDEDETYFYIKRNNAQYQIEKEITRQVVKISEMKEQNDILSNKKRIIYPYEVQNNKVTPIEERTFAALYPRCYKYFLDMKEVLQARGKGKHTYTPFYSYGRTQGLNRKGVKILTPTFSKTPRFLLDKDENSFFTNGYGVYFTARRTSLFSKDNIASLENSDVVQKILNSIVMEYYVDKTSVAIEGGYPCYQKNFIERFTIPPMNQNEISLLRHLNSKQDIDNFLINKYHLNLC